MENINDYLTSLSSDFKLKVTTSAGYFTFSNSGRRDSIKEFSLGIPEVISMLEEIYTNYGSFKSHNRYIEGEWRSLGADFFSDLVIKNACAVQTRSIFETINKILTWVNESDYQDGLMPLSEVNLQKAIEELKKLVNFTSKNLSVQKTSITDSHNTPIQKIFYGVPGCGKSHKIKEILEAQSFTNKEYQVSRVVFHPEYTNADFIGQILPGYFDGKETIDYRFSPGPFSQILRRAYLHPDMSFFLIIEEINRGNAAAIFGDIFQLLDRHGKDEFDTINDNKYAEGWSSYSINNDFINWYIRKDADKECKEFQEIPIYDGLKFPNETEKKKYDSIEIEGIHFSLNTGIRLPPNLSLLATMNTSDQNVFTLDNAFQRRWDMELVENEFEHKYETEIEKQNANNQMNATITVNNQYITWYDFQYKINEVIAEKGNESGLSSMEDKRLGCWFVKAENGKICEKVFANKVLKYLWDDAFKFCRDDIFTDKISNFEKLQNKFKSEGFNIFSSNCGLAVKDIVEKSSEDSITQSSEAEATQESSQAQLDFEDAAFVPHKEPISEQQQPEA